MEVEPATGELGSFLHAEEPKVTVLGGLGRVEPDAVIGSGEDGDVLVEIEPDFGFGCL